MFELHSLNAELRYHHNRLAPLQNYVFVTALLQAIYYVPDHFAIVVVVLDAILQAFSPPPRSLKNDKCPFDVLLDRMLSVT